MTPQAYAEFIRQIALKRIWLDSAHIANRHGPQSPTDGGFLHISTGATWEQIEDGFRARYRAELEIAEEDTVLAEIEVVFGLDFASRAEMTGDLFKVFEEVNLPVNTWPYIREFLANTMGRMNWVPFTLPTLKRGIRDTDRQPGESTGDRTVESEEGSQERTRAAVAAAKPTKASDRGKR